MPNNFKLLGLNDIGLNQEIPEPGFTIKENSFLKADFVRQFLQLKNLSYPVFADDSGLEVFSLNNAPGVNSAVYAGEPRSDEKNNLKLQAALINITNRRAQFVTIITLIINNQIHYFEGEIKGSISYELRGKNGFGYDPLFIPQGYRSTFAELPFETKNTISHRAIAIQKLMDFLKLLNI